MTATTGEEIIPATNIIIPVYRNFEVTQRCLNSVLSSELPELTTVTIVDDASPEQQISELCRKLADEARVELLINDENRGFVASVNRGFMARPDADVLLLNSDTEVANDWLARIRACAYRSEKAATVTPFSNNATICSYPYLPNSGPVPRLWDTASLDEVFHLANEQLHADIPTGVGFCMFIKRACLNQIGMFDEESFGLGYGEECDFSLRAQAAGWQNVVAADVFVFHEGAVSFSTESGVRKEKAELLMQSLHPEYDDLVTRFIQRDTLSEFRDRVDARRLALKPEDAVNLIAECSLARQALTERAAELHEVLLSERTATIEQEKALGKSIEEALWLDQEMRKYLQQSNWFEGQLKISLEQSVWLQEQLDEHSVHLKNRTAQLEEQSVQLERQSQQVAEQKLELDRRAEIVREQGVEVKTLDDLLKQCRAQFARTDEALAQAQQTAASLSAELVEMKQSRFWRYTAWMRRSKGGL